MNWLSELRNLTELKARFLLVIWLLGALLQFLPMNLKEQMGLAQLPLEIQPWLGLITLTAFVMWIVQAFYWLKTVVQTNSRRTEILSHLETLSRDERDIFIQCLALNQRTIKRNITNSAVHSLTSKRLLNMASGHGSMLSWPYTIPNFVWKYIKRHEEEIFPELYDEKEMKAFEKRRQHGWMR